jgi:hypothetical protein
MLVDFPIGDVPLSISQVPKIKGLVAKTQITVRKHEDLQRIERSNKHPLTNIMLPTTQE